MIKDFRKICLGMTYRDMVDLSTMISEALPERASPDEVANVLVDLPIDVEDNQLANAQMILGGAFGRKRAITISPMSNDTYKIACASFEGAVVFDTDIREGISQLLDTITILKALE